MIVDSHQVKGGGKNSRDGELDRNCPWCWRGTLTFRAFPASVRLACARKCGYETTFRRSELSKEDEKAIYP